MSHSFYRYVPHAKVDAFAAVGWIDLGLVPGHHGIYSCRMKWEGEGDPPDPDAIAAIRSAVMAEEGA